MSVIKNFVPTSKKLAVTATVIGALIGGISTPSISQQALNSIEVLVNDEPISSYDIDQRLRLVIAVSGGVKSEQEFIKVREQVIRSMIDERLQLQEAGTVDLVVDQGTLDEFFGRRAQGLGQSPEQLEQALQGIGSSKLSMQKQIEAEFAWSQLVEGRLGAFVSVSDEEVEGRIQKIFDNKGKFEFRIAEVTLDIDSPAQEASVKENAEQLVARLKGGATFGDIAQQLSSSPTAAVGGDLGWTTAEDLRSTYVDAASKLEVGQVSDPIRTAGGYAIIALRDRRRILVADPLDTQLMLHQIFLPTALATDAAVLATFKENADNLHTSTVSCEDTAAIASRAGADERVQIGTMRLRDLQGDIRAVVSELGEGQASTVQEMADGHRVLVVCQKAEPQIQEPDFDQIFSQIEQQRLSMMGRRYLRDLRRDAIIDYR
jgi:peptidyl-prolyl cis-trans isomerase SurA